MKHYSGGTSMPMDADGHERDDAEYRGLDPDISEQYVQTQFYAGMEKLEVYLTKQAAFEAYMDGEA